MDKMIITQIFTMAGWQIVVKMSEATKQTKDQNNNKTKKQKQTNRTIIIIYCLFIFLRFLDVRVSGLKFLSQTLRGTVRSQKRWKMWAPFPVVFIFPKWWTSVNAFTHAGWAISTPGGSRYLGGSASTLDPCIRAQGPYAWVQGRRATSKLTATSGGRLTNRYAWVPGRPTRRACLGVNLPLRVPPCKHYPAGGNGIKNGRSYSATLTPETTTSKKSEFSGQDKPFTQI